MDKLFIPEEHFDPHKVDDHPPRQADPAFIHTPYAVPYYAQVASPTLATDIFDHGLDPYLDPNWAQTGAKSPQEYAYWAPRACGPACLKMAVEALGGPVLTLMDWVRMGLQRDGYILQNKPSGEAVERGWSHCSLAKLIQDQGFSAQPRSASLGEIVELLAQGKLVIASVSYELGTHLPITRNRGHLVLIIGALTHRSAADIITLHNPSGRTPELQSNAHVDATRFNQAFSGRVIVAWQPV
ncbi:MAG: C39 family peptidase [Chloroflexi bacterium]|nr:C39 family peptidase [Chloroflexota bacterium]